MATKASQNGNHENGVFRPTANFSPSIWGNILSQSIMDNQASMENMEEIEILKEEIMHMLLSIGSDTIEKIELIDTLERLGISYHFEKEIDDQMCKMFDRNAIHEEHDLYKVAQYFRLLRKHGYKISSDYFYQFKDNKGKFKETLLTNIKGLLSLYEATQVREHGDDILEEAFIFTRSHLDKMSHNTDSTTLGKQVTHALMQSLHRGIPRAEAHFNISIYEEYGISRNEKLLRLAKLDYNLLQMLHKEELSELTQWWKDLNLVSELTYVRDRMVECYFWTIGVYFEPQYSRARIMLAKCIAMISVIDDTYDSYGTLDELEIFTEAIDRWDISEIDRLPIYMKTIYTTLLDLFKEYDVELEKQDCFNGVDYVKEAMKEIARSYYIEATWFLGGKIPSFEEYLSNALITGTYYLLAPASLLGMRSASRAEFDWIMNKPKILVASALIGRVIDDVATYEIEKERGQIVTGLECYMNKYNVSIEEASKELSEMAENAWKDLNKECIKPTAVPAEILMRVVNLTRLIDVVYKNNQDGYSDPKNGLKHVIEALLVNPINM